jgi:hypothetical protein
MESACSMDRVCFPLDNEWGRACVISPRMPGRQGSVSLSGPRMDQPGGPMTGEPAREHGTRLAIHAFCRSGKRTPTS